MAPFQAKCFNLIVFGLHLNPNPPSFGPLSLSLSPSLFWLEAMWPVNLPALFWTATRCINTYTHTHTARSDKLQCVFMCVWSGMKSCLLVCKCVCVLCQMRQSAGDRGGLEAPYGRCVAHRPLCTPLSPLLLHPFFFLTVFSLSLRLFDLASIFLILAAPPLFPSFFFFLASSVSLFLSLTFYILLLSFAIFLRFHCPCLLVLSVTFRLF